MIKVDRTLVPKPNVLDGTMSLGTHERVANQARLSASPPEKFTFKVYKDPSVTAALEVLFAKKCAYCESSYAALHPVDVEHFRPKSEVRHSRSAPPVQGYWWLAAEWENLYPSCIDCNRARYHEMNMAGQSRSAMRGKENLFPLAPPICDSHTPGCELTEDRLLLDPCVDDPSQVFDWTDEGVILGRTDAAGMPHRRALPSIECYGLDRNDLFLARRSHALFVLACIARLKQAEQRVHTYPEDASFRKDVEDEMNALRKYVDASSPYAGMARELIHRHYRPI